MRTYKLDDLWADTSRLSNRERSKLHEERAKAVLAEAWATSALPIANGKVSRSWLVGRIGCGTSAPSQNHRLKRVLSYWDKRIVVDPARCVRFVSAEVWGSGPKTGASIAGTAAGVLHASNVVPLQIDMGRIEIVRWMMSH